MGPKEKKAQKPRSPRKMASKKTTKPLTIEEVATNVHCSELNEHGARSKETEIIPAADVEGDHGVRVDDSLEAQGTMANLLNKANDDAPFAESVQGSVTLKEQLLKVISKEFTVDADVVVNAETNRFTEPGSGKIGANVRSLMCFFLV